MPLAAITVSMLFASCASGDEPTSATTTVAGSNDAEGGTDSVANRRAKAIQATGTKSNDDLLRSVETSAD